MKNASLPDPSQNTWTTLRTGLSIFGAFILFLFALDLMTSSLQHLGKHAAETILMATANPFTGLFIGLLVAAMLQSSSTTTAMVVAFVASGAIEFHRAIPIMMGANIGTTITSTIVSLGFISKKKEFKRAVAAGTYHDFFNILTVIVLFPLEYYYGFLSSIALAITNFFFTPAVVPVKNTISHFWFGFGPIIDFLIKNINNAFLLAALSLGLLFCSILIFRRLISDLLEARTPEVFSRFFFKSQLKSFMWGILTTGAIRSSTITTSVVVPIVAKRIATLKQAAPFIMGANMGTTITAFIAATLNANASSAISIAIVHFLFNLIGILLFFPIPVLRKLPMELASSLGRLTLKYRLAGFVYLLVTFFFFPFSLIYLNQDAVSTLHLTYVRLNEQQEESYYRIITRVNARTQMGDWSTYIGRDFKSVEEPTLIHPVYIKNNTLFVGSEMYLFNKPGFCWNGENDTGVYQSCIEKILPVMQVSQMPFDSVYVYTLTYPQADSAIHQVYVSAPYKVVLQHDVLQVDKSIRTIEKLVAFEQK